MATSRAKTDPRAATRLWRSYAMSGTSTPVSSANSYSDADVRAQSVWQAEINKLKVAH